MSAGRRVLAARSREDDLKILHKAKTVHQVWCHLKARWYFRGARRIGPRVRVIGRARVRPLEGALVLGERVRLIGHIVPVEIAVGRGASLTIGDRTFINYGTSIGVTRSVTIGADCNLGPYVNIVDTHFHRLEPERRGERPEPAPVVIRDNVWLATRVMVLPGVTIGEGSVVAAGSVVKVVRAL
jgi:maltose O-acetyltransferase